MSCKVMLRHLPPHGGRNMLAADELNGASEAPQAGNRVIPYAGLTSSSRAEHTLQPRRTMKCPCRPRNFGSQD